MNHHDTPHASRAEPDPDATGPDLVALVGSRIAHDLNNPIGAIANGVELLGLTGQAEGPELALIDESVENARRRIKTFRIAFGAAAPGQVVSAEEIAALIGPSSDGRRVAVDWPLAGDLPRQEAKLAMLALMCLESTLPWGGQVQVAATEGQWQITATAERIRDDPTLWGLLDGGQPPGDLTANAVHFAIRAREAARRGRRISVSRSDSTMRLAI